MIRKQKKRKEIKKGKEKKKRKWKLKKLLNEFNIVIFEQI
jgi:hypothetical protein